MRKLQVYHEAFVSELDKSGLEAFGTRSVYTNNGDAANPFIRARLVAQETKIVSELTPEDASSTLATTPELESLKVMLSRCMTGKRRAPAEEKVLGFCDVSGVHFHSPARRTISRCHEKTTSPRVGMQFWTKPCMERRMLHGASMLQVRMPSVPAWRRRSSAILRFVQWGAMLPNSLTFPCPTASSRL